jgi:hypothetical protein
MAGIRSGVWDRIPGLSVGDEPVIMDLDASLVEIHSRLRSTRQVSEAVASGLGSRPTVAVPKQCSAGASSRSR